MLIRKQAPGFNAGDLLYITRPLQAVASQGGGCTVCSVFGGVIMVWYGNPATTVHVIGYN